MENHRVYARDEAFWNKYMKGRPQIPEKQFERIAKYHQEHGGKFGTVHDIGAGVGVHSERLAKYFDHVIISDVVEQNVTLAKERLGTEKYSYYTMSVNDADVIPEGTVDMVFAGTMMHFADFDRGIKAIAKQLKPGGTFAVTGYGTPIFKDQKLQETYSRMWCEGVRITLRHAKDRKERLLSLWKALKMYDSMPIDEELWLPGAERVTLNCGGKWPKMAPDDVQREMEEAFGPQNGQ